MASSPATLAPVREMGPVDPARFLADVASHYGPVVMRGQAAAWPSVRAALTSDEAVARHIAGFDTGVPVEVLIGPPEIGGRFFYDGAMHGCNFQKRRGPLTALLQRLLALRTTAAPDALYAGAAIVRDHLPGWAQANPFPFPIPHAVPRLWIGNATHVATHFDEASNVAIVVAGRRRFTLFPPEQLDNLYVGPLDFTIAGPPVSMVDLNAPDLATYPRFAQALEHAQTVELAPGDAIYIPPIWWHDIQALDPFNVMANFWWEEPGAVSPLDTLARAIRSMRDLPPDHRRAWRHWFERYVFDDDAAAAADHLPDHARGLLARKPGR